MNTETLVSGHINIALKNKKVIEVPFRYVGGISTGLFVADKPYGLEDIVTMSGELNPALQWILDGGRDYIINLFITIDECNLSNYKGGSLRPMFMEMELIHRENDIMTIKY